MTHRVNIGEVYDKNINFLIGSGASVGLIPTLSLGMKIDDENNHTIETLATEFDVDDDRIRQALLFMHYYRDCLMPAVDLSLKQAENSEAGRKVTNNYRQFLHTLIALLERKKSDRRCNIFTTNYDGCFPLVADSLLSSGQYDLVINDGADGFRTRLLDVRHYNKVTDRRGMFGSHRVEIPQINLLPLHGSVHWQKVNDRIRVDYASRAFEAPPELEFCEKQLDQFSQAISNPDTTLEKLRGIDIELADAESFLLAYQALPIVNPTKWKFHETVFEEHYYQLLRLLSYELEKPDSVLITFGFSFADEHLLSLVRRALTNPKLQVFVCCYDKREFQEMTRHFKSYRNVQLIASDDTIDFTNFNESVFSLNPSEPPETPDTQEA